MGLKTYYKPKKVLANFTYSLAGMKTILDVSDNVYELLGFKSNEFLNNNLQLKSLIHLDDEDISSIIFSSKNL